MLPKAGTRDDDEVADDKLYISIRAGPLSTSLSCPTINQATEIKMLSSFFALAFGLAALFSATVLGLKNDPNGINVVGYCTLLTMHTAVHTLADAALITPHRLLRRRLHSRQD